MQSRTISQILLADAEGLPRLSQILPNSFTYAHKPISQRMSLIGLQPMSYAFGLTAAVSAPPGAAQLSAWLILGIGNVKNLAPESVHTMDPPLLATCRELLINPCVRRQRIPIRDVAILGGVLGGMHSIEMLEHPRSPFILSACPIAPIENVL